MNTEQKYILVERSESCTEAHGWHVVDGTCAVYMDAVVTRFACRNQVILIPRARTGLDRAHVFDVPHHLIGRAAVEAALTEWQCHVSWRASRSARRRERREAVK